MPEREYILDDGRKIRYWIAEWTNSDTDTTFYRADVTVYERRRRLLTLGLTKTWKATTRERDTRINHNERALRERMAELRSIAVGEEQHPLDKLVDNILEDIEPNHNS